MEQNWLGPYRIHESLGKSTYILCDYRNKEKVFRTQYNMTRLKLYHEVDTTSNDKVCFNVSLLCSILITDATGFSKTRSLSEKQDRLVCMGTYMYVV